MSDLDSDFEGSLYAVTDVKGSGSTFPADNGLTFPNNITFNIVVSKFLSNESRFFATYFGGEEDDRSHAIAYQTVPDGSGFLYVGSPAKPVRKLSSKELGYFTYSSKNYCHLKDRYLAEE